MPDEPAQPNITHNGFWRPTIVGDQLEGAYVGVAEVDLETKGDRVPFKAKVTAIARRGKGIALVSGRGIQKLLADVPRGARVRVTYTGDKPCSDAAKASANYHPTRLFSVELL